MLENVVNLMLLPIIRDKDPHHITSTQKVGTIQVALKKVMKKNASAFPQLWRAWLSKFIFKGFLNHEIMVECIPLAICLAKGMRIPLASLMLGSTHIIGCVTNGKALKEYPRRKCGYINGTTSFAYSWIRKRKVKEQILLEDYNFLDDHGSFNIHAYKMMPRTFTPPKGSFSDGTFVVVLGNQIVDFVVVLDNRKSMAQPLKSKAQKPFALPVGKQSKAKSRTPSKAKATKEKGKSEDTNSFGPIPVPSDDKAPSKSQEAKKVKALAVKVGEALATLEIHRKILVGKASEPLLLDDILSFVNNIIDWGDPTSFTVDTTRKGIRLAKRGAWISYSTFDVAKKSEIANAQPRKVVLKPHPISELPLFRVGDIELVPRKPPTKESVETTTIEKATMKKVRRPEETSSESSDSSDDEYIDSDKSSESDNGFEQRGKDEGFHGRLDINNATPEEFKLDVGNALKELVPSKDKSKIDELAMSAAKKAISSSKAVHSGQSPSILAKLSEANDFVVKLLKDLNEMNEDRDVLLALFELIVHSKAKKVMIKDVFMNFCMAMQHMEAYLGKDEFNMVGGDMAMNLDEQIKEQAKHVKEMEKSLAKTKKLIHKLEEGLKLAKAHLESLN
ncbi:hypothetical protein SLEP1_g22718 [Rubroshorea leprosula]|uniref:Uncharacterized protein n=1 Tax=Rubroshorea leprosula TaxID=152421 RepID=A0AAV5JJ90_9ROSI|nr:hypothetical protein SLEP1_g22718 [Rubroshorea leprosula]